jgi:hypothetical protein
LADTESTITQFANTELDTTLVLSPDIVDNTSSTTSCVAEIDQTLIPTVSQSKHTTIRVDNQMTIADKNARNAKITADKSKSKVDYL